MPEQVLSNDQGPPGTASPAHAAQLEHVEALHRHALQQHQLFKLAETTGRASELGQIYDAALGALIECLGADRASILLFDHTDTVRFVAWRGLSDEYRAAAEGHSPWEREERDPRPIAVNDVSTLSMDESLRAAIRREGIGALAFIPLVHQGRLLGKFMVYFNRPHEFGEDEVQLAQTIAANVAFAIERRRAEEALRVAKEEAERASEAKSEFLATLSHELRTPLTPVLLTVSLLESDPRLPAELREDVATIRRNVELESRLISDLLDLTRISRGKMHLEMRELDLHLIIRSAVDVCQREASAKLSLDLAARHHTVRGDGTRLQQIFWNLINNAIKFTGPDGRITVRSADAGPDRVRVEVSDTGVGIDPVMLPRLFTAFEQGDVRSGRQFAGLGLGLAISRRLVEAHEGTISAYSEGRGRGATFAVELPVITVATSTTNRQPSGPSSAGGQSLRILLVEDHEPTLHALRKLLQHTGHRVTAATTLESARGALEREEFDLLISDLGLPDGSGLDLMRQIRGTFAGAAIALTGYGMESDIAASQEAGFAEHLTKPVDLAELQHAISQVTNAHPVRS